MEEMNQAQAQALTEQHDNLTSLARAINEKTNIPDYCQQMKGIVTALNLGGTPPTVSVQLDGDTSTSVSDIRFCDHITPVVGDVVVMLKFGSGILIVGQCTTTQSHALNGWITPTLASGYSVYSNDPLMYRVVFDNGSKKVQWRGRATVSSGTPSTICTVEALARPLLPLAPILVARGFGGGSVAAQIDVLGNGNINLVGATAAPDLTLNNGGGGTTGSPSNNNTSWQDAGDGGSPGTFNNGPDTGFANGPDSHSHWVGGHQHNMSSHSHSTPNHTHTGSSTVDFPDFVSLNGVEYFI